jgi:hypothetical protein
MYMEKFPTLSQQYESGIPLLHIVDEKSQKSKQLKSFDDIYPYCIIQLKQSSKKGKLFTTAHTLPPFNRFDVSLMLISALYTKKQVLGSNYYAFQVTLSSPLHLLTHSLTEAKTRVCDGWTSSKRQILCCQKNRTSNIISSCCSLIHTRSTLNGLECQLRCLMLETTEGTLFWFKYLYISFPFVYLNV